MSETSDADLLHRHVHDGNHAAFAELVARHLNLVYSVARRHLPSSAAAEDIAQSVFIELARHGRDITPGTPLIAWLHVVARRLALNACRDEARRRTREHVAADLAAMHSPSPDWPSLEPLLDEAVESLPEPDRHAILLRFFENKSFREVGAALGLSDDAAQKRVSRALDQLRTLLTRRGATVTAAALATELSAHAIHLAPAALGVAITSAVTSSATALATAVVKTSHTVSLAGLQKTIVTAALATVVGLAIYETAELLRQRDALADAPARTALLQASLTKLNSAQVTASDRLHATHADLARLARMSVGGDPEVEAAVEAWLARARRLKALATERPAFAIPEFAVLTEADWFRTAKTAQFETDEQLRNAFGELHKSARETIAVKFGEAIPRYASAHHGQLPTAPAQLAPFIEPRLPTALFDRYEMLQHGSLSAVPAREWLLAERPEIAAAFDDRVFVTAQHQGTEDTTTVPDRILREALRAFVDAHHGTLPTEPAQLLTYFRTPPGPAALKSFLDQPKADFQPELKKLLPSR